MSMIFFCCNKDPVTAIIRPGKLDLLFLISLFLDLGEGRPAVIIHYSFTIVLTVEVLQSRLTRRLIELKWACLRLVAIMKLEAGC